LQGIDLGPSSDLPVTTDGLPALAEAVTPPRQDRAIKNVNQASALQDEGLGSASHRIHHHRHLHHHHRHHRHPQDLPRVSAARLRGIDLGPSPDPPVSTGGMPTLS
jgi:hypothetical protein